MARGRRILVLATKAMLLQFQQKFWNRFSIPLASLDSDGIRSIRNKIPANHNPFFYFDKAIISIDKLKRNADYRVYLEKAYWDIIEIDEAHNVALRDTASQRAKLAQLLSSRSDSLIMLTDGKPESFASLINMLDPTAIADPGNYTTQDFPDRVIERIDIEASPAEDRVFAKMSDLTFNTLDDHKSRGARLFATVLAKSFFSNTGRL